MLEVGTALWRMGPPQAVPHGLLHRQEDAPRMTVPLAHCLMKEVRHTAALGFGEALEPRPR